MYGRMHYAYTIRAAVLRYVDAEIPLRVLPASIGPWRKIKIYRPLLHNEV